MRITCLMISVIVLALDILILSLGIIFGGIAHANKSDVLFFVVASSVGALGLWLGLWVLRPGDRLWRVRVSAEAMMAAWTIAMALRVAMGDEQPTTYDVHPSAALAHIIALMTKDIALWIAGIVPCGLLLWWTRKG